MVSLTFFGRTVDEEEDVDGEVDEPLGPTETGLHSTTRRTSRPTEYTHDVQDS